MAAFAGHGNVTSGKMMSSFGLKVDGKIFAMLVKGQFVAKLPRERVDELVNGGGGEYFDPGHGRLMKEWVAIGAGKADWVELAKTAYDFVNTSTSARRPTADRSSRSRN